MIKLSLNSSEAVKAQIAPQAPFANTLAAAVEAAGAAPATLKSSSALVKKAAKPARTPVPSNGLLTRGVQWLQNKGRSKKRMQMIETVSLGDKRFVALVKVDGREFLLGGAPTSVGMLADLGAHGLGELLNVADLVNTTASESPAPATAPEQTPIASLPLQPHVSPSSPVPEQAIEEVKPLALELPAAMVQAAPVVTVPPTKLSVTIEADEDESDWLLQDEASVVVKSTAEAGTPTIAAQIEPETITEAVRPGQPRVSEDKQIGISEVLKPVAVPTPMSAPRMDLNFTFQMWGAPQPAARLAPVAIQPGPVAVVPVAKAKTRIDLENCPELLGEPYVLALVDTAHGAAA